MLFVFLSHLFLFYFTFILGGKYMSQQPLGTWTKNSSIIEGQSFFLYLPGFLRSTMQWHCVLKQRWSDWWYRWQEVRELSFIDSELEVTGMLKCQWQMEGGKIRVECRWQATHIRAVQSRGLTRNTLKGTSTILSKSAIDMNHPSAKIHGKKNAILQIFYV